MLEGLTALGYMAAHSRRARLGLMVGGIHYRTAGLWIKAATTLDVLSGGRAYFGIGAAWNEQESRAWGFPMPPLGERFEMLEETLQLAHAAWTGEQGTREPFDGRHYQATDPLNSPQALSKPHPPILIGGGGERRTLKYVASTPMPATSSAPIPASSAQVRRAARATARPSAATTPRSRRSSCRACPSRPTAPAARSRPRPWWSASAAPRRPGPSTPSWAFATWPTSPSWSSSAQGHPAAARHRRALPHRLTRSVTPPTRTPAVILPGGIKKGVR